MSQETEIKRALELQALVNSGQDIPDEAVDEYRALLASAKIRRGMYEHSRPPLGVMPKYIWDEKRMNHLKEAIDRYILANQNVPAEWISEYHDLMREAHRRHAIKEAVNKNVE